MSGDSFVKSGKDWQVKISKIESHYNPNEFGGDRYLHVIRLDIESNYDVVFRAHGVRQMIGFYDCPGKLPNGKIALPSAHIIGQIYGTAWGPDFKLENINMPPWRGDPIQPDGLYWRMLGFWPGEYYAHMTRFGVDPLANSFHLHLEHPYFKADIRNLPQTGIPAEIRGNQRLLKIDVENDYWITQQSIGRKESDEYRWTLTNAPNCSRIFILTSDRAFEFTHPAISLCFANGYNSSSVYRQTDHEPWILNQQMLNRIDD